MVHFFFFFQVYSSIFNDERVNPNGCTAKGTFFVSHKYTNYSAVQASHIYFIFYKKIFRGMGGFKLVLFWTQFRPFFA